MRCRLAIVTLMAAGLSLVSPASAETTLRVPLDTSTGFTIDPGPRFRGSVSAGVLLQSSDKLRLGAIGALVHDGSLWRGAAGPRLEYRLLGVVDMGLFAAGELMFGESQAPLSFGILFDAGGLIRTGPRIVQDLDRDETSFELTFGVDLTSWIQLLGPSDEDGSIIE